MDFAKGACKSIKANKECISGHTLSSSLQNCKAAISVLSFLDFS